jgi:hypothetical protein
MRLPGFDAETSLAPASGIYRGMAGGPASGGVLPMQFDSALGALQGRWPVYRCCGWSAWLQRYVCVSRVRRPWESCTCTRTPYGPIITCSPGELTTE